MSEGEAVASRRERLGRIAGAMYLEFYSATDYPEQCPEYQYAKWHDLLWLLIPIAGIVMFTQSIKDRHKSAG